MYEEKINEANTDKTTARHETCENISRDLNANIMQNKKLIFHIKEVEKTTKLLKSGQAF